MDSTIMDVTGYLDEDTGRYPGGLYLGGYLGGLFLGVYQDGDIFVDI